MKINKRHLNGLHFVTHVTSKKKLLSLRVDHQSVSLRNVKYVMILMTLHASHTWFIQVVKTKL